MTDIDTETQDYFDLQLPAGKEWFTPKEVAAIIPWGERHVRDCLKGQRILGHASSARVGHTEEQRRSFAIPRAALILFMAETANYTSAVLVERFCDVVSNWPPAMQRELRDYLNEQLEDGPPLP